MTDRPQQQRSGYSGRAQQQTRTQDRPRSNTGMPPPAGAGNQAPAIAKPLGKQKLFEKFGAKFGVDEDTLISTMKATCFRGQYADSPPITDAQLVMLLIVADQYGLNPFTKEIYAYPDKNGGIVAVVSVDGWIRIINEHPQFNGMDLAHSEEMVEHPQGVHKRCWEWLEVTIHRKDRDHTTPVTEYFDEVYRPPIKKQGNNGSYEIAGPWQSHTKRLMRHKGIIQAGRVVFGFAGIYDEDEAQRILDDELVVATVPAGQSRQQTAKDALRTGAAANTTQHQQEAGFQTGPASQARADAAAKSTPVKQPGKAQPWDEPADQPEENAPTQVDPTDEDWIRAFRASTNLEEVMNEWDACVTWHDDQEKDIAVDVEATMHNLREKFQGK